MKNRWISIILLGLVILGYFIYRSRTDSQSTVENKPSASAPAMTASQQPKVIEPNAKGVTTDHEISIPKKFQLKSVNVPANFKTDEDLRNSFDGSDRLVMDEFYGKFDLNAVAFNKPEQYEWLVKNGYPMPQDVVAAQRMSIDELGSLVDQGNVKASYFYLMREIYAKDSGSVLDRLNKTGYDSAWSQRLVNAEKTIWASGSPFVGYMLAARAVKDGNSPESVYAGYALASVLGDARATNALAGKRDVDLRAFVSNLGVNMDMMRLANPNVFVGKPAEFPDRYSVGVAY